MKILTSLILSLAFNFAQAYDATDIAGTFRVSLLGSSVYNIVSISEEGRIQLTEYSNYGRLECSGRSKVVDDVMYSDMVCRNGRRFSQAIRLADIYDLENNTADLFRVRVISTLFSGRTKTLTFERMD